ncbi:MAG: class I SAM-dependent methyltransferase [Candidatus Omnitrophota bacterium]
MENLRERILEENIKLHKIEAEYYDRIHPEEFNWFEQGRIWQDLKFIRSKLNKGLLVLDMGCGTGNLTLKLLELGCEVRGVDISADMVAVLAENIPERLKAKARLSVKNIEEFITGCEESFDCIVTSSVLHHLPDYIQALEKVSKLLKPGGWLYITHEPAKEALAADPFLRKILWQVDNLVFNMVFGKKMPVLEGRNFHLSDYHLYHGFDEETVIARCRDSQIEIVKLRKYSSAMRLGIFCWFDSMVLKSKRQFSIIGQKVMR